MQGIIKTNALRSLFAGLALLAHSTTLASEGLELTLKTITGYADPRSEGTWVNDLTHCFSRDKRAIRIRVRDEGEIDVMRPLIAKICPALRVVS